MSEDAISRDAVLDACSQSINILDAMSRIEDLPSVTLMQKTGHWDEIPFPIDGKCFYCDKCGRWVESKENYCPECGAKMEEQA